MTLDLFKGYNEVFAERIKPGLVLGPPASGKCFLITKYFSGGVYESIIGFPDLKPAEPCAEHEAAGRTHEEEKSVLEVVERVFPWIKALADAMPLGEALEELRKEGFGEGELDLIGDYFRGAGRLPKQLVERLVELRRVYGPIAIYRIPWDVERYGLDRDAAEAVDIIKKHFEKRIRWLGADYIPPGLAADVVNKIRRSRDEAEEYVKEQAEAYREAVELLVGERDDELKGAVAEGLRDALRQLAVEGLRRAVAVFIPAPASEALTAFVISLAHRLTKRGLDAADQLARLGRRWGVLHLSLRRLVAAKAALQIGATPAEAERLLDQLAGNKQLWKTVAEVQAKLKELEERVDKLEDAAKLIEAQVKGFAIYKLEDVADGLLHPNVKMVGGGLGVVSETYGRVEARIVRAGRFEDYLRRLEEGLRRGPVVLVGPKGVGKSTLAIYALWELLREGGFYGVVKIEELADVNARLGLENFLKAYERDFADAFGRLIILYDPSPAAAYTVYGVETETGSTVANTVEQLARLAWLGGLSMIVVVPSDVYNALGDEIKNLLGRYRLDVDLSGEEYIGKLLEEYSGCALAEEAKREIVKKILQFREGYALIARLAGEELRRSGCRAKGIEELLEEAEGDALAFIVHYVNKLLKVADGYVDPQRAEKLSRLFAVRRPFVAMAEPGGYVMPSGLVESWFGWEVLSYSEGEARWLAARHHQLVEETLAIMADAATGRAGEVPEPLEKALDPWIQHSDKGLKEGVKLREAPEAVRYFAEKYGERLREELSQCAEPKCWRRLALMASAALTGHPFKALAEAIEKMVGKGEDVFKGLVEAVGQSGLDRLFLEEGDLTPFSRALLRASALPGFPNSVYAAVANRHREIADETKALWQKWEERRGSFLPEAIYAVGLAALLAKAMELGVRISAKNAKVALRAASFSAQNVLALGAVADLIATLSPLGRLAPGEWAVLLYAASQIEMADTSMIKGELDKLYRLVQRGKLWRDWVKAYMAVAYANLGYPKEACSLLDGITDDALKAVAEAFAYYSLAMLNETCPGVDTCKRLVGALKRLMRMVASSDLLKAHKELAEYLGRLGFPPMETLGRLLREAREAALSGSAICALDRGEFREAEEHYGEVAEIMKSLEEWNNYLVSKGFALRSMALGALPDRADELLRGLERLWEEALAHWEPTARYLEKAIAVLGEYLIALALNREHGAAIKLLEGYGQLLKMNPKVDVAMRLTLNLLGVRVEAPSGEEILMAILGGVNPIILPALAEALSWPLNIALEYCESLCRNAYLAVRGDAEAGSEFMQWVRVELMKVGVAEELLREADVKQLVEVLAPRTSFAQFILLMRALASGYVNTALLHAEYGARTFKGFSKKLFDEVAEVLRKNDWEALRTAVAKLYYYHL